MKSKTLFSFLILCFSISLSWSQETKISLDTKVIFEEVKKDVWVPFLESYRDLDINQMLSIQDPNMTRVSIDKNSVRTAEFYFENLKKFFNNMKTAGYKMNIEFSIISTAVSEDKVYQRGYYSVNIKAKGAEDYRSTGYSQFTVLLTKPNGKWKTKSQVTLNKGTPAPTYSPCSHSLPTIAR